MKPILYIVIPCYNESKVLPLTAPDFLRKLEELIQKELIASESRILFVDDGSTDDTWSLITKIAEQDVHFMGISQSRNRGHQNAVLAGLMESKGKCDITITIDCDGQDDLNAMNEMVQAYLSGCEVVYGVRDNRETDSFFKKFTAESYYKMIRWLGADVVFNHADYRLLSSRVLMELSKFKEVNIFLRGMIPLVGFKSTSVYYKREKRVAGESHYPLVKMLHLAFEGITSLSVKPLHIVIGLGFFVSLLSFAGVIWAVIRALTGHVVVGWASTTCIVCFVAGIQLICLGVLGEYIGKIYMEVKGRPRYIISERTKEQRDEEAREEKRKKGEINEN